MKDFYKIFTSDEILNSGTSEGVKKGWETRKGNRIGGSGVDADYPKNPHDFSKSNLPSSYHKAAGSAAALSSLAQNGNDSSHHAAAKEEHLKAAWQAEKSQNSEQAQYHRDMADRHSAHVKANDKSPFSQKGVTNSESFSDRLLNSKFTGGIKLTVSELSSRLVNALAACDKLKNSSINDILCPDEKGNWTMVLNDSKVPFTLKDGQPLLNWDHKEKKEYQPWDEEPKVDGAWDEDLIGNCDEEGMANSKPK